MKKLFSMAVLGLLSLVMTKNLSAQNLKAEADTLMKRKNKAEAHRVANDYLRTLYSQHIPDSVYNRGNLDFAYKYTWSSADPAFTFFMKNGKAIDQRTGVPNYANGLLDFVIAKEEIDDRLWPDANDLKKITTPNPDWQAMIQQISQKYGSSFADRTILGAQLRWYRWRKDSIMVAKYLGLQYKKESPPLTGMAAVGTNNDIYYFIFRHSEDGELLEQCAKWMEAIVRSDPKADWAMDTYANVLYKLGRKKEALQWEEKAHVLDPKNKETAWAIERMRKGEKTW